MNEEDPNSTNKRSDRVIQVWAQPFFENARSGTIEEIENFGTKTSRKQVFWTYTAWYYGHGKACVEKIWEVRSRMVLEARKQIKTA